MTRDDFVRRASLGGVIVATAVISYTILRDRAVNIGFVDWWTAWLYPIGLDALILGASRVWGQKDTSPGTRRMAMIMTLGAIGAGIAAFVVEFYPKGWIAVGFAILIPASLAASLVLTSRVAADKRKVEEQRAVDAEKERASRIPYAAPTSVPLPQTGTPDHGMTYGRPTWSDPGYGPQSAVPPSVNVPYVGQPAWPAAVPVPGPWETPRVHSPTSDDVPDADLDHDEFTAADERDWVAQEAQDSDAGPRHAADAQPVADVPPNAVSTVPVVPDEPIASTPPARDVAVANNLPEHPAEQTMEFPRVNYARPQTDSPGPPAATRDPNSLAERQRQWVRDKLDAGDPVSGADVDRAFPEGSRNGARIVRQVREERAGSSSRAKRKGITS